MGTLRLGACAALIGLVAALAVTAQSPSDAQAMQSAGDWRGAESVWRALAARDSKDYRLWTSLGVALAHQSKFNEAIQAYLRALALNPYATETNLNLGLAYFKSGELEKAVPPLKKAAAQLPENQQIETVLGMSLYGTGKYREALPHLEAAEAKTPDNKDLAYVVAQAYLWSGQYDKAKAAFQTMLERDPDSPEVEMLLGEAYDGLGRTEEAIDAFRKAAIPAQTIPDAHFGLGYLLWKTHKYEQAATEFHRDLTIDSKNYKALAYLGDCEYELGNLNASKRDLLRAIDIQDALWITHFDLGKMEANDKHYEAAMKEFRRAIEIARMLRCNWGRLLTV
jgi:tetratricopeptide (TPR) repeat protein